MHKCQCHLGCSLFHNFNLVFKNNHTKKCLTAQKMKFSIKDFLSKCDQIYRKLWIWSHLAKRFLLENFIFFAVCVKYTGIRIFLDQHFPVPGQNFRFCPYTRKNASKKIGILAYFTQCLSPISLRYHTLILL